MTRTLLPPPRRGHFLTIDILRGLALLGVLIVHFTDDFSGVWTITPEEKAAMSLFRIDDLVNRSINFLIVDKARTIFSFLFGVSFYLQVKSASQQGVAFLPLFLRRLAILMVIGLLHAYLLFGADILRYYVIGGLVLLLTHRWSLTRLVWTSIGVTIILPVVSRILLHTLHIDQGHLTASTIELRNTAGTLRSYWVWNYQLANWYYTMDMVQMCGFPVIGNMLFGVWMARKGYLQDPAAHSRPLSKLFKLGLGLWVISKGSLWVLDRFVAPADWLSWTTNLLWIINYEFLALGYVCGIALLCQSFRWQHKLSWLAPAGRMTLTNYISQPIIGILIFEGSGLFGRVGSTHCLLIAIVVCWAQLRASQWWLSHFRMGPLEWVWRSLAAGEPVAMRLEQQEFTVLRN